MKLRNKLITLLCVVALLCAVVPPVSAATAPGGDFAWRSEERRVGKEC